MSNLKIVNPGSIRKQNTMVVLNQLRLYAPLSRAAIAARTGLTRGTITGIVNALLERNLVRETELARGEVGRPGMSLELNPCGGCAIGVEIGADFISVLLTDFVAQKLWFKHATVECETEQNCFIEQAEDLIQTALNVAEEEGLPPFGIGLGIHGMVDFDAGLLKYAPNLHWRDIPFRARWEERFGVPVFVENDANAAALGEYYFGVAHNVANFIYLSTGIGLGGGIIIDGRLFRGASGYAGEIGHTKVQPNGKLCACGQYGCLETLVGSQQIAHQAQRNLSQYPDSSLWTLSQNTPEQITFDMVVQGANNGDSAALTTLQETGYWLGKGIANLMNLFNPQLIVVGGVLNKASSFILPKVEEIIQENAMSLVRDNVKLAVSAHAENACVYGGVALVLDSVLHNPVF